MTQQLQPVAAFGSSQRYNSPTRPRRSSASSPMLERSLVSPTQAPVPSVMSSQLDEPVVVQTSREERPPTRSTSRPTSNCGSRPQSRVQSRQEARPQSRTASRQSVRPVTSGQKTGSTLSPVSATSLATAGVGAYRAALEEEIGKLREARGVQALNDRHNVCRDCQLMELRKKVQEATKAEQEAQAAAEAAAINKDITEAQLQEAKEKAERTAAAAQYARDCLEAAEAKRAQRQLLRANGRTTNVDEVGDVFAGLRPDTPQVEKQTLSEAAMREIADKQAAQRAAEAQRKQEEAAELAALMDEERRDQENQALERQAKMNLYRRALQEQTASRPSSVVVQELIGDPLSIGRDDDQLDAKRRSLAQMHHDELARMAQIRADQKAADQLQKEQEAQKIREADEAARKLNAQRMQERRNQAAEVQNENIEAIKRHQAERSTRGVDACATVIPEDEDEHHDDCEDCQCEICRRRGKPKEFSVVDGVALGILKAAYQRKHQNGPPREEIYPQESVAGILGF